MYAVETAYIVLCTCACYRLFTFAFHLAEIFIMTNYKKCVKRNCPYPHRLHMIYNRYLLTFDLTQEDNKIQRSTSGELHDKSHG